MGTEQNLAQPQATVVTLTIDDVQVKVPKGTNLIEAVRMSGGEVPHYCYHPDLSVAGNCRMCQVKIEGRPKLEIACNTVVQEGMQVRTHKSSPEVKAAQEATLEFILINHPLDCTVCDESGQCKLQDYHYKYNARASRFIEHKVNKVKATPLGPQIILDGERCIMCTRCIRFCDEVTKTSELGMLNRGDKSEISVNEGRELNNDLDGSLVDLCPVGALTHRNWRFNTRIWFTKETDSICPGCSTGCNAKVAVRDGEVVFVKARYNAAVNKEWMCNEGRYGFNRFLPKQRILAPSKKGQELTWEAALGELAKLKDGSCAVFLSPSLLLEDYFVIGRVLHRYLAKAKVTVCYWRRELNKVEAVVVSPDYAANYRGAEFVGLVEGDHEASYTALLEQVVAGNFERVLFVGDHCVATRDIERIRGAVAKMSSVFVGCSADHLLSSEALCFPARSILEVQGLMINGQGRLQHNERVIDFPQGTEPVWRIFNQLAKKLGHAVVNSEVERDLTKAILADHPLLKGLSIADIKSGGVCLRERASAVQSKGDRPTV